MEVLVREDLKHLLKELDLLKYPSVEIGVAEGNFSRDILNWGVPKHYSVDSWTTLKQKGDGGFSKKWHDDNYDNARKLLYPFGERSVILRGLSVEMANKVPDNSVGFIHLDGDHSYEGVMADLHAWFPKLVDGGIMSGHDYLVKQYGVNKAVNEFAAYHKYEVHTIPDIDEAHAGFWFQKIGK